MEIIAKITRGPDKGKLLKPHQYKNGKYVVSLTQFAEDQLEVNWEEIIPYLLKGYKLRMSDPITHSSPTLLALRSITFILIEQKMSV